MRTLCLLACWTALPLCAQRIGSAPNRNIGATDIDAAFRLPPLADGEASPLAVAVATLQVGNRAKLLGLNGRSATDAWMEAQKLLTPRESGAPGAHAGHRESGVVAFSGGTASALNRLLANPEVFEVRVTSPAIAVDQPIEIRRNSLVLDLGNAQLADANPQPYMIRIENAADIALRNGQFVSGNSAILVNEARAVTITGAQISGLTGAGVVITGSTRAIVTENRIAGLQLAGIVLHGGTSGSIVEQNEIDGCQGFSNEMAGIVITDREVDLASDPRAMFGPNGYGVIPQPMSLRIHPPHDNLIAWNRVTRNSSSGIYSDGGVRNVIYSNLIQGNSKEGLCLDDGSTANVVASNTLLQNGNRWGDPDWVLALDFIQGGGRLPDGTAAEKVPGISLDNAIYNILFSNTLQHNSGGGIKIVRTGYFNEIGLNVLLDNNDGNSAAYHFFGIELGAAPHDETAIDLNFTPSRGNIVFSNSIRGSHYSGIYLDAGSDTNNILDNTILDATAWAIEAGVQMTNFPLNNLTNLPSRNIGSGLDPALIAIGQPMNDPH